MQSDITAEIIKRTKAARDRWDDMLNQKGIDKLQLLMDTSTWDCNKPQIAQYFYESTGNLDYLALDTRSDRRLNISFQPGTMVQFNIHHDRHTYGVPSFGLILKVGHVPPPTMGRDYHDKTYMIALDDRGKMGSLLYVYDPWVPVFEPLKNPDRATVDGWLRGCIAHSKSTPIPYYGTLRLQLHEATGVYI